MVTRTIIQSLKRYVATAATALLAYVLIYGCTRTRDVGYDTIERKALELRADVPATLDAMLTPGAYTVAVREEGVDVAVRANAGETLAQTREPVARHGIHVMHIELQVATPIRVEVKLDERGTAINRATIEIRRWPRTLDSTPSEHERGDQTVAKAQQVATSASEPKPKSVVDELKRASVHYAAADSHLDVASVEYALASIQYFEISAWLDAEEHAVASATAYARAGNSVGAARARVVLAAAQLERANEISSLQDTTTRDSLLRSADEALALAIAQLRGAGQFADQADAANYRGIGRWYARDFDAARGHFLDALSTAKQLHDAPLKTRILSNLAWLDFVNGRPRDAAEEYRELLGTVNATSEPQPYAAFAANYALVLAALGDFDSAIKLHAEILDRATAARDESLRLQQLVAIASLSLQQGDAQRALAVARTALAMPGGLKERSKYNSALRVAGEAALQLADYPTARDHFGQLLDRSVGGREIAHARVLLAQSLRGLGRRRDAAAQLAQALVEDDDWIRAQALTERAQILLAARDAAAAARDLEVADAAYAQLGLDTARIQTGALLARARSRLQDHDGALAAADRAIHIARDIRARSSSPEIRASFLAAQYAPYEAKIAALLARSRSTGGRDSDRDTWAAIATAENARAQTLSELREGVATRRADDNIAVARARDMLIAQRLLLERRLQRSSATDPAVREIQRDIAEASARLSALAASGVGIAASRDMAATTLDDATAVARYRKLVHALPATVALAYFFVGDEETHYWLVHRAQAVHYLLPGRRQLAADVQRFIGVVEGAALQPSRFGEASTALDKIAATIADTRANRVVILADGPLNSLPFAALRAGRAQASAYLVESAAFVYVPSLAAALRAPGPRSSASRVAVISDPVYAIDDVRLASAGPVPSHLRGAYDDQLTRLPYSMAEAREIKRLYAAADVIDLAGFDATAVAVSQLPFSELRVLHFAAHAIARDDDPQLSALHLTAYNNRRAPLENRAITAESLLRLGMRADLVVLSGCSTAGATPIAGEGMLGLTHSFLANGSRSVVAALWPVDDAQTARFMARFHAAYRAGASADDALAQAQRESLVADAVSVLNWSSFVIRSVDLISRESK